MKGINPPPAPVSQPCEWVRTVPQSARVRICVAKPRCARRLSALAWAIRSRGLSQSFGFLRASLGHRQPLGHPGYLPFESLAHRWATVRIGCHPWQADTNPVLSTNSVLIAPAVKGGQRFSLFWRAGNLRPHDCVRLDGCPEKKKPQERFGGGASWRGIDSGLRKGIFNPVPFGTTPKNSRGFYVVPFPHDRFPARASDSN